MIALAILMGFAVLVLVGRWISRRLGPADRRLSAALLGSFGLIIGSIVVAGLSAPFSPWDTVRLAPSMALVRGINPYAGERSGVVLSTMYGPVAILAFVPAAWFGDASSAVIVGRWLAFLFTFGPVLVCSRILDRSPGRSWRFMVLALGGFAMLLSPALRYSTTYLHADAPALGLTALACLLAARIEGPGWFAAIVCVFALLSKQTLAPLPFALLISAGLGGGRDAVIRFGLKLVVAAAVSAALIGFWVEPRVLYLNLVKIPGGVPWRGHAPWNILSTSAELFAHALPLIGLVLVTRPATRALQDRPIDRATRILLLASLVLTPMAILGRVKQAGDINSFSPCLYPLFLGGVCRASRIESRDWLRFVPGLRLSAPDSDSTRLNGMAAVLGVLCAITAIRLHEEIRVLSLERPFQTETRYLAAHPHSVYFPWNPSVHASVDGRPAHHLFSAWERGVAGFPVEQFHLRSAVPTGCRYVAFPLKRLGPMVGFGSCLQMLEQAGMKEPEAPPVRLAGLPDYECYEILR